MKMKLRKRISGLPLNEAFLYFNLNAFCFRYYILFFFFCVSQDYNYKILLLTSELLFSL